MPRPLRLQVAGGRYHVVARGVDGAPVVFDDRDRKRYLALLVLTARRYRWRVHAYCLMTTHLHLVVETPLPNLSRGMQYLQGRHAQRLNERWGRFGPLFAGRFDSRLIEDEAYFWEACRYVLENPVKAGLCADPREWRWSGGRTLRLVSPLPSTPQRGLPESPIRSPSPPSG
jgi:REP element-mobilizing transposase RayT